MAVKLKGQFIDPMLLLRTDTLPNDGSRWEYQLKFDGYRAIAFKTGGNVHLRSRNDNDFSVRYSGVVKGLAKLPDETVIDGEVIALDDDGRPSFSILQNYGSSKAPVVYFVFDVMVLAGRDVMKEPLETRYAAKYSVAALLPWVAAIRSPVASPSPIHPPTHTTFRDQGTSASVLGARIETAAPRHRSPPRTEIEMHDLHRGRAPASPLAPFAQLRSCARQGP